MQATSPIRLLLWLKWTLIWRGYRRNRMKVVSTILSVVFLVPASIGLAYFINFLIRLHTWTAPFVARDALAIIYLIWVLTPLLGFQLNDSFDLTKLFTYPISYRQIFFGSVVGSMLDLPVLLTLPTFATLLAFFSQGFSAWPINLIILLLFLLHTLALGQAITLTLIGFLRSRRFRDISVVVLPLVGMSYYIGQRVFFSRLERGSFEDLLDSAGWRVMNWLPPGWAAQGLARARNSDWATALLEMGLLAAVTLAALWVAATSLRTLYLGDRGPLVAKAAGAAHPLARAEGPARQYTALARFGRFIPAEVAAIKNKEFIYLTREPQYKAMAINVLYTLVAIAVPILLPIASRTSPGETITLLGDWVLFALSGTLLLALIPLLFNIFGGEGAAITVLFSFPTRRRSILLGKNLAHVTVLVIINFAGLALAAALTGHWGAFPLALIWTLLAAPVLLAAGNLVSIRFPHRMLVRGQRWSRGGVAHASSEGGGCAYGLLYLLAYGGAFAALLPALAAVLVPRIFGLSPLWYALSLPIAFAYAITLYVILLGQSERWLLAREPEIAERILPPE